MSSQPHVSWCLPETFTFEGQAVRYGSLGEAHSPPLVLLHGTPFSSIVWRRVAPYLRESRRVFYFDLLGYGRSEMRSSQDVSWRSKAACSPLSSNIGASRSRMWLRMTSVGAQHYELACCTAASTGPSP
jgi:pimeloyl-ACP methyl ester carboxylesterase